MHAAAKQCSDRMGSRRSRPGGTPQYLTFVLPLLCGSKQLDGVNDSLRLSLMIPRDDMSIFNKLQPLIRSLVAPVLIGGIATALGVYRYRRDDFLTTKDSNGQTAYIKTSSELTFDVKRWNGPIRQSNEEVNKYILLDEEATEKMLHAREQTTEVVRPGNPVVKWDVTSLPTQVATEDRHAIDVIPAEATSQLVEEQADRSFWDRWLDLRTAILPTGENAVPGDGRKDLVFASVFDGHGGLVISHLLSKVIHPALASAFGAAPGGSAGFWRDPTSLGYAMGLPRGTSDAKESFFADMIKTTYVHAY
jgi:hypothetical protein